MSQKSASKIIPPLKHDQDLERAAMENNTTNLKLKLEPYLALFPQVLVTLLFLAFHYRSYDFVVEILGLKPELVWAKNPDGHTAMHISCQHGLVQIVSELATMNSNLCRVRDNLGRSPVHIAAANGRVKVLQVLIRVCPDSLMDFTPANETALHVAAKNGQVECFRVLMQHCLEHKRYSLLTWRDNKGNSVFDIAVSTNQKQVVSFTLIKEDLKLILIVSYSTKFFNYLLPMI